MQTPTESTASTQSFELAEDVQGMADFHVKEITDSIVEDPWISTSGILKKVARGGPRRSQKNITHLFGGVGRFVQTCHRLEVLRGAVVTRRKDLAPFPHGIV